MRRNAIPKDTEPRSFADPMEIETFFTEYSVRQLVHAVSLVRMTKADKQALNDMADAPPDPERSYFDYMTGHANGVTPGLWAVYMLLATQLWNEETKNNAYLFPSLREIFPSSGELLPNELFNAAAEAFSALSLVGYGDQDDEETDDRRKARVSASFYRLALSTEKMGDSACAYDLASIAVALHGGDLQLRERIVRYGLTLATRPDQTALMAAQLAVLIARAADHLPSRRLEAFDACERAIEFLPFSSELVQREAVHILHGAIGSHEYLRPMSLPLSFFVPEKERPAGLSEAFGADKWPDRISQLPTAVWGEMRDILLNAQTSDLELEKVRLSLEPPVVARGAQADWITWMIDHPAYRRVVPHFQSFLREKDFDRHLLQLTHEITHVLSMLGGLGSILTALRVAAFYSEIVHWSNSGNTAEEISAQMAENDGIAALSDGNAGALFRAEQSLEIALKARILQDVWTPWFEGLAVFAEGASDPALDPIHIGPVSECLRNMIDYYPDPKMSEEELNAAYQEILEQFEARCSNAFQRLGPERLRTLLGTSEVPYLAGYVAVRSVVSTWRQTTGRPLSGAEVFSLLLHATRFGSAEFVPDLSLSSEQFATVAQAGMCDWAAGLAALSREEIEHFLAGEFSNERGRWYRWQQSRLISMGDDRPNLVDEGSEVFERRIAEAMRSLSRPEDFARFSEPTPITEALRSSLRSTDDWIHGHKETGLELFRTWVTLGSLLPIGRTASRFFANIDKNGHTILATHMRTAEASMTTGEPSVNGMWFSIDNDSGDTIEQSYRRTGNPRLEVNRIIDLNGLVTRAHDRFGSHFLAYRYEGWFHLRGANPAVDIWLNQDPEHREMVQYYVERRLCPDKLAKAELAAFQNSDRGARRTLEWINRSLAHPWHLDELIVEVGSWPLQVRALAEKVLDEEARRQRQRQAAQSLLKELMGDESIAHDFTFKDFASLGEHPTHSLNELKEALFATAMSPSNVTGLAAVLNDFNNYKFRVFSNGTNGWDVRPAHSKRRKCL